MQTMYNDKKDMLYRNHDMFVTWEINSRNIGEKEGHVFFKKVICNYLCFHLGKKAIFPMSNTKGMVNGRC